MRWLLIGAISGLTGACGSSSAHRFTGDGIAFAYPSMWHAHSKAIPSNFSTSIVYLSPQKFHAPCTTHHGTYNTTIFCHQPIARLQPGSILASWSINAMPDWSFTRAQGTSLRIGGRPAKLSVTYDSCGIAADETMAAVIPAPTSGDSWYEFDACIRAPGLSRREHQVRDLLRSVRFTS